MTITKVIKALYIKLGGSLTDTYSGIAGGAPVSSYSVISDCIKALYVLYGGDLSEVYSGISDVAVKDYTTSAKAIAALAKVISKGITPTGKITITENGEYDVTQYAEADVNIEGITVNENYDISEGTLTKGNITLEGDVTAHIPDGVTTIGNTALTDNAIVNKVIMPNSVIDAEDGFANLGCFANNRVLKEIILSSNLTKIAKQMFYDCYTLTSITIPDSVTSIGESAFLNCRSLTSITIPDSVTSIGANTFDNCTALTSIVIPDSVTSIGDRAFYGCTSLTDIYYTGTQTEWEQITIVSGAIPGGVTMHYEYTPE